MMQDVIDRAGNIRYTGNDFQEESEKETARVKYKWTRKVLDR